MVDFKKRLSGKKAERPTDPSKLYDTLDRAHDKGPLRPAQLAVLQKWFTDHRTDRDVIVKLHTGQGKTLIGLLILQSQLNSGAGPALYLCPDNFLIEQTIEQAKQFGIATCQADPELPDEFVNGDRILVTSVQKLFNGLTKFGLNRKSIRVGTLLMDDAHACADTIREACRIRIPKEEPAYDALKTLFADDLEQQGLGTFADINNGKRDALLPIPYWAWIERESDVAKILAANAERKSIKFAWPLLKNILAHCQCIVSGVALEIEPNIPPLEAFGSYADAAHRVFMSATVTDDAFLVKGLQLKPETIINPLTYSKEGWSGEKMVLLPSLIHEELDRERIVKGYATPNPKRRHGVVALATAFARVKDWEAYGAVIADRDSVGDVITELRKGEFEKTVVLVNRYDGIDLPDETCRLLVFDGKPYSESLIDLYEEACRPDSVATLMRTVRTVEQGMGRSVRGEKDYSVIVIIGSDITRLVRDRESRKFLSSQMSRQIEIGLEIAEMAKQDIESGQKPADAFNGLVRQCLQRDEDWKAFYVEQMAKVKPSGANERVLRVYASELAAEQAYRNGDYATAADVLQKLLDKKQVDDADKGWYLQQVARYQYRSDRPESQRLQVAAHKENRFLLRPSNGVTVAKLTVVSQGRVERIMSWVRKFETYEQLDIALSDILGRLVFGTKADKFEQALDETSRAIGFAGERPDKEWKEGPDNLWALDDTQYILWECKSEVEVSRAEINKREAEQMNRSSAWFDKHYAGMKVKRVIVHPAGAVASAASFTHEVEGMRETELRRLVKQLREFFKSFEAFNFKDMSATKIQKLIDAHGLSVSSLLIQSTKKLKDLK
ncbi:DEAD/DEAH box helicase family protein [Burkholderia pseudomallei]|uniref:DEAD/DEAH box helicase family protein n=1 Tax=Burkholderia pseudomallei TaxID=28450 RepID=UPI002DBAC333|nr:DEAD/DEAH box helicase family protein [Burkholderia pseudomallei]MEB5483805.1 DEAD/DEAH box helicase family protein [Burkholderia pseudomallei]MEB5488942.1 DEAD/DEAH box helicase family protein [Burkholderia pseudomallei]MEB5497306.1 DEAD/DEAH box helicase family protein [Burkholderia pseudomallei]MEB5502545.1 DEAD/DEAH box helicase family protein [Burkholderia pseudomallei]MEB5508183.1 DEAD/DEAH box helicase family protein [Burkholderia pseudomallei]